jgi:ribosomal protein S18 acetylase RimI-like enzyme
VEYTIRQAEPEDQEALVDCVQAAYTKYIERIGKRPAPLLADYKALIAQRVVYVLAAQEGVRGVLVMMPQDGGMFVENVAIDPLFQRQGLGRALMAFAEQQARKAQLGEIRLYTNEVMTENLLFYQQLGFEEEGRQVQNGYHRVFLRKGLR